MKILVIHASAGAGHLKAAEAIYQGLIRDSRHHVVLVDALDYTSPFSKKLYREAYAFVISRMPRLWGFLFSLLDVNVLQPFVRKVRRAHNALSAGKLHRFLREEKFDYIFSTHFMPNEVAAALKRSGRISARIISVITDFDVHKIWLARGIDRYAVASEWTKKKLNRLGVEENRVFVTGIPTHEKFSARPDIGALKNSLGLQTDEFTVLIATGSFGIGPIEAIIKTLEGFQVMVVCGHNKSLFQRLSRQHVPSVKVLGLVNNMHELMAAADAMVTKPGGLSIAEALVSELPLIFFNAIPGQETNNIKVLKEHGIGFTPVTMDGIAGELKRLRSSKDEFLTAVKRASALARPNAVRDIISLMQ